METREEITAKHADIHKTLESQYYNQGEISKEEFDRLHGENWINLEAALILNGFLEPRGIIRRYDEEIDEIRERVKKLERPSP